jgi:hypothetical protein
MRRDECYSRSEPAIMAPASVCFEFLRPDVKSCFLHAPDSHLLAIEPPEFSLED